MEGCDMLIHRLEAIEDRGSSPKAWAAKIAIVKQLKRSARHAGTLGDIETVAAWARKVGQQRPHLEMMGHHSHPAAPAQPMLGGATQVSIRMQTAHGTSHLSHSVQAGSGKATLAGSGMAKSAGSGQAKSAGSGQVSRRYLPADPKEEAIVEKAETHINAVTAKAKATVHHLEHALAKAKTSRSRAKLARETNAALIKHSRDEVKERFIKYEASQASSGHEASAAKALT